MTLVLAGSLLVLALLDSTSFGTLLIPIWFLLAAGRVPIGRILVFLGTVAGFYFAVGLGLLFGLDAVLGRLNGWLENPIVIRAQLAAGVGLLVWSFFIGKPRSGGGRLVRWRARALGQEGSGHVGALVTLALGTTCSRSPRCCPTWARSGSSPPLTLAWRSRWWPWPPTAWR